MHQFPGIFIPKLTKRKLLVFKKHVVTPLNMFAEESNLHNIKQKTSKLNPILAHQFEIFRAFLEKMCDYNHLVKNPTLKLFLEKKSDLRSVMTFVLKQYQQMEIQNADNNKQGGKEEIEEVDPLG